MTEHQDMRIHDLRSDGGGGRRPDVEAETQRLVNAYFNAEATFWTDIYDSDEATALIVQRRRDIALAWIDELQLPARSRILDVGCGAGLLAVELAKKGFEVDATDTVGEMIERARRHAEDAHVDARVHVALNDVHKLAFDDETFDVVIAMGVVPWLHSPQVAMREIKRVLRADGHLIITANNRYRLPYLLDPIYNPAFRRLRKAVKRILAGLGIRFTSRGAPTRTHSLRQFDALLGAAGLQRVVGCTVGFGPLTFFRRSILPGRLQRRLHLGLQLRADRGVRGIRSLGSQYVVIARRALQ
jgi:2-polyprenyl-3-methyl-5-hydroxy-6-metoxy-1,4-benzoquinol methylase